MRRLGTWPTGLWLAAGAIALMAACRAGAEVDAKAALTVEDQIRENLKVANYQLQMIVPRRDRRPQDLRVDLMLGGRQTRITLQPHSLRSPDYKLYAADGRGRLTPVAPGPVNTYRGVVEGRGGSTAAASFIDGKLSMIIDDAGETWWVQPVSDVVEDAIDNQYVVYRNMDVLDDGGRCGTVDLDRLPVANIAGPTGPPACIASADIAFDADFEYFSLPGLGSVLAVEADINSIMNAVEFIYRRDCEIAYNITTIIVRTAEPDPYNQTGYVALINEFRDYWNLTYCGTPPCTPIDRAVAHMFTGKDIDPGPGGVIGVAYSLNGICTDEAYAISESRFSTTYSSRVRLTAHELGHNWSADHCNANPSCSIMCSSVSGCVQVPMEFESPGTREVIIAYRDTRTCLGAAGAGSFGTERIIPNPSQDFDNFGYSVDLSADVLIGGAPQNTPAPPLKPGAAFVFRLDPNTSTWVQDGSALIPSDGFDEDRFGISVGVASSTAGSLIGDVAIIGAHQDDDGGRSSGSAYIFRNDTLSWSQIQKITAFDQSPQDLFGFSTSISPAGTVVVISSHGDDDGASGSGAAYVYRWDGVEFVLEQKLKAPIGDIAANDNFGFSVAVAGPPDHEVAVIGSFADDDLGMNSGSAYIFRCNGKRQWVFEQKLTASDGLTQDQFGLAVAIHSSPTLEYVLIGAPMADSGPVLNTGAAYLYQNTFPGTATWTESIKLQAADSKMHDQFGTAVAITEFVAIVGNYLDDAVGLNSGSAYLYRSNGAGWALDTKMVPTDAAVQDQFGISVAAFGERVAVGAWRAETPAVDGGAVYVTTDVVDFEDCNKNGAPDDCEIDLGLAQDCNLNQIPDECDIAADTSLDCDANGVPDECDVMDPANDCNANGVPDTCDVASGTSSDCNRNNIPDECEVPVGTLPDCNNNGIPDICDIFDGTSQDCNANNVPDECDIPGVREDCNLNGIPDSCDIAGGTSEDCNGNGIPDECDTPIVGLDCNLNGIPDSCELAGNDCNFNGIPDDCDIANNLREDCNLNGVPDSCEIDAGAPDCNNNGIPDFCDLPGNDCNGNLIPDECDLASGLAQDCNLNLLPDSCDIANGTSSDGNGNGIPDECDIFNCPPDLNNDGVVNVLDMLAIISSWGPCPGCPADVAPPPSGDGQVNILDLLEIISSWGSCT